MNRAKFLRGAVSAAAVLAVPEVLLRAPGAAAAPEAPAAHVVVGADVATDSWIEAHFLPGQILMGDLLRCTNTGETMLVTCVEKGRFKAQRDYADKGISEKPDGLGVVIAMAQGEGMDLRAPRLQHPTEWREDILMPSLFGFA